MKKITKFFAVLLTAVMCFSGCSSDDNESQDAAVVVKTKDKALLLVTFGSTWDEPQKTYDGMLDTFKKEFPDADVYLSFTSTTCITRWGAKTGEYYATPDLWLNAIGKAGYKDVMVQSLHVIPGEEYTLLRDYYVKKFKKAYTSIPVVLGEPLLVSDEDIKEVGDALYTAFKPQLEKGEAVAFMGHGNPESSYSNANMSYQKIKTYMQTKCDKKMFVGTVDCEDMLIGAVITDLKNTVASNTTINLTPLMSIAGDHANNDMAGDYDKAEKAEDQSWKVQLNAAGYKVENSNCILKGLGDYPAVVNVWIRHLNEAIAAQE